MSPSELRTTVRAIGDAAVIDMRGEIDGSAEAAMDAGYGEAAAGGQATIVLNFEAVDYINSTGIALVVGVLARARAEGRTLVAVGLSEHYREIFTITRLSDYMQMYTDLDAVTGSPADA